MRVIWLSPTGSDYSGDGNKENPYKTIDFALTIFSDKDQIRLLEGTYTTNDSVIISGMEGSIFSEFPRGATIQPLQTSLHQACLAVINSPRFTIAGINILPAANNTNNTMGIYASNVNNFLCTTCTVSNFDIPSGAVGHGIFASGSGRIQDCKIENFRSDTTTLYGIETIGIPVHTCEMNNLVCTNDCVPLKIDGNYIPSP